MPQLLKTFSISDDAILTNLENMKNLILASNRSTIVASFRTYLNTSPMGPSALLEEEKLSNALHHYFCFYSTPKNYIFQFETGATKDPNYGKFISFYLVSQFSEALVPQKAFRMELPCTSLSLREFVPLLSAKDVLWLSVVLAFKGPRFNLAFRI